MSGNPMKDIEKIPVVGGVLSGTNRLRRQAKTRESKPVELYIAEFFLFLVIAVYFCKLTVLGMGFVVNYGNELIAMITYIVDVLMLFMTIDAILGISSKKPASWRKVMRSSMLLLLFSVMGALLGSSTATAFVALDPIAIAIICMPVAAIMFMRSTREYYAQPMLENPPLRRWISYSLFGQLYPAEKYQIEY